MLATFAVYAQVRHFDFVYDDPLYVSQDPHVRDGLSAKGLTWALTSGDAGNWFPVTRISYLIDYQLFGLDAGMLHLTNLLFHGLNTLLLFALLRRLTGSRWRSAFVAAMFAWHPLHVESVAWITERKDVLSGFFWFAALLAYVHFVRRRSLGRYLLVVALFCLGLMSKPVVVTLPLVLILLDVWPLGRIREAGAIWEKTPLLALSIAASVMTYVVQSGAGAVGSLESLPLAKRLGNASLSYILYGRKTFWPTGLAAFYPYPAELLAWQVIAATFVLLAITGVALLWLRRRPWFATGWFWYLVTLVPMIGLVQVGAASHADRYMYISAVGLWIMLAWGGAELAERWPRAKPVIGSLAAASCAACLCLTWFQAQYWENTITLFRHAIQVTDGNWVAYNDLGAALRNQGQTDEAIADFSRALEIRSGYLDALVNRSEAYNAERRHDEAARDSQAALSLNPASVEAQITLGSALGAMGRFGEAELHFREAVRMRADDPVAHNDLGIALASQGKVSLALEEFAAAVRLKPDYANAQLNLGAALANSGRLKEAVPHLSEAVRLQPDSRKAQESLESVSARLRESERR